MNEYEHCVSHCLSGEHWIKLPVAKITYAEPKLNNSRLFDTNTHIILSNIDWIEWVSCPHAKCIFCDFVNREAKCVFSVLRDLQCKRFFVNFSFDTAVVSKI